MNDKYDDLALGVIQVISNLPPEEQEAAVASVISIVIKAMSKSDLEELKKDLLETFPDAMGIPVAKTIIELIEGQMALRTIGDKEEWR